MNITTGKKFLSVSLSAALAVSAFAGMAGLASTGTKVSAAQADYQLADTIQEGTILHCFDWKYTDIKAELPNIAKAGFTSVQTSPAQGGPNSGVWYWLYQPLGFEVKTSDLGTKEELKDLCDAAEEYGIKVVVDVVANHLAGNNRDQLQKPFDEDAYWHNTGKTVNDTSRVAVTTYNLGNYGDIKSEDEKVIQAATDYVDELASLGVDGIRWDAAKHIALPSEECGFWSSVTDNDLYHYGEILGSPVNADNKNDLMKEYTDYMSVTDNTYGNTLMSSFKSGNAPTIEGNWTDKGISSDKLVYWGESHDTYANKKDSESNGVDQNVIDRAYAVAAARVGSSALYLSRPKVSVPDQMMAGDKGSMHFTSPEIAAVNHFHNAASGVADAYGTTDNVAVVTRDGIGAVLVLGSGSDKEVEVDNVEGYVPAGTYIDEVSGNTFTVTDSKISGKIGSSGIAVVYNSSFTFRVEASPETDTSFDDTLKVTLRAFGTTESYYTVGKDNGVYSYKDGDVITIGADVEGGTDVYLTLKGHNEAGETVEATYVYTKNKKKDLPKLTKGGVIFDNDTKNWDKVYVYIYDERSTSGAVFENAGWPGVEMTKGEDNLYTYEFPDKFTESKTSAEKNNRTATQANLEDCKNIMIIFNNGAGSQLPAKDGYTNDYDKVGYYNGGETLEVVQTFETSEGGNSGNEGGNSGNEGGNSGNEGGNSGNEGGNSGNEGGNSGNSGNEGGNTTGNTDNNNNAGGNTTGNTGNNGGTFATSDVTPVALVAAFAAISAGIIAVTARKKHDED